MNTVPLTAERAGLVLDCVRDQLRLKLEGITNDLDDFAARTDEVSRWADTLAAHGEVMRQAEGNSLLCSEQTLGIVNACIAEVDEEVKYLLANDAHDDDKAIAEGRLVTLTTMAELIQERMAPSGIDLTAPYRRELIVGMLSSGIGKMADSLGWESTGNSTDGPQDGPDVVVKGIESQRGYLARLESVGEMHRPLLAAALDSKSVVLPAHFDLVGEVENAIRDCRESIHDDAPIATVEKLVAATRAAEEWLTELTAGASETTVEEDAPEKLPADVLDIDLTAPWRREILAQVLASRLDAIGENLSSSASLSKRPEVAVDYIAAQGVESVLRPWLEVANSSGLIVAAVERLLQSGVETLTWELPKGVLVDGLKGIVLFLTTDAIGHSAADPTYEHTEDLVGILRSAQTWLDELGAGDE